MSLIKWVLKRLIILGLLSISFQNGFAQKKINELPWTYVAIHMPDKWYGTQESKDVAENILLYQRKIGGWPKNIQKHLPMTEEQKKSLTSDLDNPPAIFDNNATTYEMIFLAKMYRKIKDVRYKKSFEKGLNFIFDAQYKNGGWPMFYPLRKGYYTHITYNDDGMVNILRVLKDIVDNKPELADIVSSEMKARAKTAFDKGIECILKTQYKQNNKLTVWCAQHDENTLLPAPARSYELPSLSGAESVGIVELLMDIENPSAEIINAVQSAMEWFDKSKITGYKVVIYTNEEGKTDRKIVSDPNAQPIWGRFYTLEDNRPYFSNRDGIKHFTYSELTYERRNGYNWYVSNALSLYKSYPLWQAKWDPERNVLRK